MKHEKGKQAEKKRKERSGKMSAQMLRREKHTIEE